MVEHLKSMSTQPIYQPDVSPYMHDEFLQSQSTSFMHQFPTFENEIEKVKKSFPTGTREGGGCIPGPGLILVAAKSDLETAR